MSCSQTDSVATSPCSYSIPVSSLLPLTAPIPGTLKAPDCLKPRLSRSSPRRWVVAESAYLIDRELGPHVEALLYQSIIDGALLVEPIIAVDWQRIRELVVQYADLRLGGTDASVIALAERLHVDRIATLNDRDFTVVRPNHTGALTLVP